MTSWAHLFVTVRGTSIAISQPWRYLYANLSIPADPDVFLDSLGSEGWELIAVEGTRREQGVAGATIYGQVAERRYAFKRSDAQDERERAIALMAEFLARELSAEQSIESGDSGRRMVTCPKCSATITIEGSGYVGCSVCGDYFEV